MGQRARSGVNKGGVLARNMVLHPVNRISEAQCSRMCGSARTGQHAVPKLKNSCSQDYFSTVKQKTSAVGALKMPLALVQ